MEFAELMEKSGVWRINTENSLINVDYKVNTSVLIYSELEDFASHLGVEIHESDSYEDNLKTVLKGLSKFLSINGNNDLPAYLMDRGIEIVYTDSALTHADFEIGKCDCIERHFNAERHLDAAISEIEAITKLICFHDGKGLLESEVDLDPGHYTPLLKSLIRNISLEEWLQYHYSIEDVHEALTDNIVEHLDESGDYFGSQSDELIQEILSNLTYKLGAVEH